MTANDLLSGSLRLIGVLASGEALSASEATDGLNSLNDMIDSWSNEDLLIPTKVREVFALTTSQTYTMGPGGNFNTARPLEINNALIQLTGTSPVVELPMTVMNTDQYASVILKTVTSTFPLYIYNDANYPLANLSVWPVPTAACSLVLYSSKPLTTLSLLTTAISLPPGYQRALKYNLAIELAPEYGKTPSELVADIARESKASLKRQNFEPKYLSVDAEIRSKPAVFNWRTGEPT